MSAQQSIDVSALEGTFEGQIIRPGDGEYEEARHIWNASIDKRPAVIVRPTGAPDVQAAVRFARERDLPIALRGGSHSVAGHSTCDGGIVIDFAAMKGVEVDPEARRARVQPGAVWGDVDRATQEHALAVPGGLISSTGVAGLTLGGGIGWLQRLHGLTCDNLVSAELVTADGEVVSSDDDPELLWGLRGGGGNFGAVTSFELALHPLGPDVVGGMVMYPGDLAPDVLAFFRDYLEEAPRELGIAVVLRLAPPAPFLPEEVHGTPVVAIAGLCGGPVELGERAWEPLRKLGTPVADIVAPRTYVEAQSMLDGSWGPGAQNYWKAEYLTGMPTPAIDVLVDHLATITSPMSDFKTPYLRGAIADVGEDETAYGHRDAPFVMNINARWMDPDDSERHVAWTRGLWDELQPFSAGGGYTNFMSEDDAHRVGDAFGAAKYARLVELKRRYDPENAFRLNQNIRPEAGVS